MRIISRKISLSVACFVIFSSGCKSSNSSQSEVVAVEDAASMTRLADGRFQVVCSNLAPPDNVQIVTADDIRDNQICVDRQADYPEVIIAACQSAFRNDQAAKTQCIQEATSGMAITKCAEAFNNNYLQERLDCAIHANANSAIEACSAAFNYNYMRERLACAKKAEDGSVVASCVEAFNYNVAIEASPHVQTEKRDRTQASPRFFSGTLADTAWLGPATSV